MAEGNDSLKNMVLSFRVSELQMLLGFAGRNKSGRKNELQARAVDLLRQRSLPIQMKIKELYKSIQQGHASGLIPMQQTSAPTITSKESGVNHTNVMSHQTTPQMQRGGAAYPTYQAPAQPRGGMYTSGIYHNPYQAKASPPIQPMPTYPIHPDVRLKKLPFFDNLGELLKPSSLVPQGTQRNQECNFTFHLTPQQATEVAINRDMRPGTRIEYTVQVQVRFCLLETSCEQEDFFPPGIGVKVNGKICPLPNPIPTNKPGVEPKRPARPVNVTPLVKLSPTVSNHISVSWTAEYNRGYVIAAYLVRKLSSTDLLQRMKSRGSRHADFTRGLIKEKLAEDADCEIATTSLRVSLVCPLGKMRMLTPCRSSTCSHLQCFDASLYLQMNERKPTWQCPVCDKPALYDNLVIDGYFQQVLLSGKLADDGNEIQLHQDGSWSSQVVKKEQPRALSPAPTKPETKVQSTKSDLVVETVADDLEVLPTADQETQKKKKEEAVIDLTFSDSDGEADTTAKQPAPAKPDSSNQTSVLRHHSDTSVGNTVNSGGSMAGPNLVSSSGYVSPSVITLDSPSPPATPTPTLQVPQPCKTSSYPNMCLDSLPILLDLESDSNSNSPQSSSVSHGYPRNMLRN